MEVRIRKSAGLHNDLLIVIPREEVEDAYLHIANRDRLRALPGLLRHTWQDRAEREAVNACKMPVEGHLRELSRRGHGLVDDNGRPLRRVVAIGSRNTGNNHGFVAWQAGEDPPFFHVEGDPLGWPSYSCLVLNQAGRLAIRSLRFREDRVLEGACDVTAEVAWCVYANWVLRAGRRIPVDEMIDEFYDILHVLALDRNRPEEKETLERLFREYPNRFRENALDCWRRGVPRNRFLHNCLGMCDDNLYIMQREGTIEEVAEAMREAGARDGLILDNGGSPFCWAWWPHPSGGFLFTAPDYRPHASCVLALVLRGGPGTAVPSGSVSHSVA